MNYKYVIGIDFGHGETSAAICPYEFPDDFEDIVFSESPKEYTIPSAITQTSSGLYYFGNNAFRSDINSMSVAKIGFKKKPGTDEESDQLMSIFLKYIYQRILEIKKDRLHDGNHCVYLACPSSWGKQTIEKYKDLAIRAGIPVEGITKESRAAFVFLQHKEEMKKLKSLNQTCIIDFGSSTIDFTYMTNDDNVDSYIDFGYDNGASKVENIILNAYSSNEQLKKLSDNNPLMVNRLLYDIRKYKEDIYSHPGKERFFTISFEKYFPTFDESSSIEFVYNSDGLNDLLLGKNYIKQVRFNLIKFKKNHINEGEIKAVYLTGGASRMTFLKKCICDSFEVSEDMIFVDENPSLTISRGITRLACLDSQSKVLKENIISYFSLIDTEEIYKDFRNSFKTTAVKYIAQQIDTVLYRFGMSENDLSPNDLINNIKRATRGIDITSIANSTLDEVMPSELFKIKQDYYQLIDNYSKMGIDNISEFELDRVEIDVDDLTRSLEDFISVYLENDFLIGFLMLLAIVPVGITKLFSKKYADQMVDWIIDKGSASKNKKLSRKNRIDLVKKFKEKNNISLDIQVKLNNFLDSNKDDIQKSLNGYFKRIEKEVSRNIKNAEIQILT